MTPQTTTPSLFGGPGVADNSEAMTTLPQPAPRCKDPDRWDADKLEADGYPALADKVRRVHEARGKGRGWRPPRDQRLSADRLEEAEKRGLL
jgi:hypothetical protein